MSASRQPDRQRCDACGGVRLPEITLVANRVDLPDTAFCSDDQVRMKIWIERRGTDQKDVSGVDIDPLDRPSFRGNIEIITHEVAPIPVLANRTRRDHGDGTCHRAVVVTDLKESRRQKRKRITAVNNEIPSRRTRRAAEIQIPDSAQTKRHDRGATSCNCIRLLDAHIAPRSEIEKVNEPLRISGVVNTNLRNIETRACVDDQPVTDTGRKPVVRPILTTRHVDEDDLALHCGDESQLTRDRQRHELLIRCSTEHHCSGESAVGGNRDPCHVRPEVRLRAVVLIFDRQKHWDRFILTRDVGETRERVALHISLVDLDVDGLVVLLNLECIVRLLVDRLVNLDPVLGRFDVDRRRANQLEPIKPCLDMADSRLLSRDGHRGKRQRGTNKRNEETAEAELEQHDSCPPD